MRGIGVLALLAAASCASFVARHSSTPDKHHDDDDDRKPRTITWKEKGAGGSISSSVVTGYNRAERDAVAAKAAKDPDAVAWLLLDAKSWIDESKRVIHKPRERDERHLIYKFETENDGTFDEDEMKKRVDALAAEADESWLDAQPKVHKLWKAKYGATSDEALAKLEELGKPEKVTANKKGTCWIYGDDRWCWTKKGKLAKNDHLSTTAVGGVKVFGIGSERDCQAILDKTADLCESADCRAILDDNADLCESADCKAMITKNAQLCESADCQAIINDTASMCHSTDCTAIINKTASMCESQNCQALINDIADQCN